MANKKQTQKQQQTERQNKKDTIELEQSELLYIQDIPEQPRSQKLSFLTKIKKFNKKRKKFILKIISIILLIIIVSSLIFLSTHKNFLTDQNTDFNQLTEVEGIPTYFYDNLTGEVIAYSGTQYDNTNAPLKNADGSIKRFSIKQAEKIANEINSLPTFCIQIPNGMDGARPQVGLNRASLVFEAIAEAGITRFAAIFKNPSSQTAIGPIRSLRLYHLDWDTPFDCTIIHAGGADDALSAVSSGYKHLSESIKYMWRDRGQWTRSGFNGYTAPNNLFTSGQSLINFNQDNHFSTSNPSPFIRLTPKDSDAERFIVGKTKEEVQASNLDEDKKRNYSPLPMISSVNIRFNSQANFNVNYLYNSETNTYFRSFANGQQHTSYTCENTKQNPAPKIDCNEPTQINPDVVIVIKVQERTSPLDNYHEDITTTGSGTAYIFQNGTFYEGIWQKNNRTSQISFKKQSGEDIKIKPGRIWISAIPNSYGQITYK